MQEMFEKVSKQLQVACMDLKKNNRINELEGMVIWKYGQLKDMRSIKKLIDEKENEIEALQSILKIPDHGPRILIQSFETKE